MSYDFVVPLHYRLISFYRRESGVIYGERRFRTFVFVEHELRNFKPHNRQMDNGNVYVVRLSYLQVLIEMIFPFDGFLVSNVSHDIYVSAWANCVVCPVCGGQCEGLCSQDGQETGTYAFFCI